MTPTTVSIRDTVTGRYYAGHLVSRQPVCDRTASEAMEMTEEEIKTDFPNGLPKGWERVRSER